MAQDPDERPFTEFTDPVSNVLRARRILSERDFFVFARNQVQGDLQNLMILDADQQNVIAGLGHAPGGVTITQGYSGTGKTHTIVESCIPFTLMPEHGIHLVFSPSNAGADKIALDVDARIQEQRQNRNITTVYPHILSEENAYVVRLHSKALGRQVRDMTIHSNAGKALSARPPKFPEDVADLSDILSQSEAIVHEVLQKSEEVTNSGILDPRVKYLTLSVGARMLQSVGLWPDGKGGFNDPWIGFVEKHNLLKVLMMHKVNGQELSPDQNVEYGEAALALYTDVLRSARVVVGTTAGFAAPGIMNIVREHVVAITSDENDREVEPAILSILNTSFTQNPSLHLVADQKKFEPMTQVDRSVPVTVQQYELPLIKRLIIAGHPSSTLVKQYRMHSSIVRPVSRIFYNDLLTSGLDLDKRLAGLKFKHAVKGRIGGSYSNAVWFDVKPNPASKGSAISKYDNAQSKHKICTGPTGSKSCQFQALHAVNLAVELVDVLRTVNSDGRVALLTQYTDQKGLHMRAHKNMKALKWEGYLNLHMETIAGAVGMEYDYVILDLVVDNKIGMLGEPEVIKNAMTRAKSGLVILASMNAIATATGNTRVLRDYKDHFKRSGLVHRLSNVHEWPPCKYLAPSGDN